MPDRWPEIVKKNAVQANQLFYSTGEIEGQNLLIFLQ